MDKSQEVALSQLRKTVEKLGSSAEKYEDPTLMRFLISKSMDSEKAAKMFVQWQKWRSEFVPSGYISDSEVKEKLEARSAFLQGLSKEGFPIMLIKASSSFSDKEIGNEKIIMIADLKGISFKNVDVRGMISCFQTLQKYEDPTLMRFLISKSMDSEKAAKMFVQWQKWRSEFVPLGYISDSEVKDKLEAKNVFLQGLSKKGFPIMLLTASRHFPSKDRTETKKFFVHILDKSIASSFSDKEIGNEKIIMIADMKGLSFKNVDVRGMISSFQTLQEYYPERLYKCYMLHTPGFFVGFWKIVCRFLDKSMLEKIVIVKNEEETRKFISEIGEEALPEEQGGRSQLIPIQDVILPPWIY